MNKVKAYIRKRAAALAVVAVLACTPGLALAQCQPPGVTVGVANTVGATLETSLRAHYTCNQPAGAPGILCIAWQTSTQTAMGLANAALRAFENALYRRLRDFWDDWLEALQAQTAQLNSSLTDGSRGLAGLFDTANMTLNQRTVQGAEMTAKKQHMPTDEGCRFDTAGAKLGTGVRVAGTMTKIIGRQFGGIGTNEANTPAAKGSAPLQAIRWANYYNLFCDKNMNGGRAACPGSGADGRGGNSQELVGLHILPAKTLFGKETIPLNDDTTPVVGHPTITRAGGAYKVATDELIYNLTGYEAPQPIPSDALAAASIKDRRAETRAYATQMDVMVSLVSNIVAERTPGEPSADIQQLRQSNGITDANRAPSVKEIQQSVLEQLWNPNYYINLSDTNSAAAKKEVYLKAYNLMLLYKLVDKTERIANAYVVETSNMIDTYQGDALAGDQRSSVPIRP